MCSFLPSTVYNLLRKHGLEQLTHNLHQVLDNYFYNIPIEIRWLFNKISWENNIENQNCIGGWWRRLRVYSFFNKIQHLMDGQRYNRYMVKYNRNNLILFTLIENYVLWTRLYKNPINSRCVIICHPYDEPLLQVDRTQWPDLTSY